MAVMMPLAAWAYEVGDRVELTPQLYGTVLSKNGSNNKIEVYANPDNKPSGALEIKNMYSIGAETYTVTMIASSGFEGCDITTVKVGAELYLIGHKAFSGCTRLKAFFETERGSVTVIGDEAFGYTYQLTNATFPGVERVGQYAFRCSGVETVEMPAVKELQPGAFQECGSLVSFIGGEKLESVGNIAFCNCPMLTGVTVGPSLTKVGSMAFAFGIDLKDMVIPSGLTEAGSGAYQGCGLTRVFILSDKVMDYCADSKILQNKTITNLYCVNEVLEDVAGFLSSGSEGVEMSQLTQATPVSIDNVLKLDPTDKENVYEVQTGIEGITDLHVYDSISGEEIVPVDGQYTIANDKVRLHYYVDDINLIDYVTSLEKKGQSAIETISAENSEMAECYTLSGVKVGEPVKGGIYICRYKDGAVRKIRL